MRRVRRLFTPSDRRPYTSADHYLRRLPVIHYCALLVSRKSSCVNSAPVSDRAIIHDVCSSTAVFIDKAMAITGVNCDFQKTKNMIFFVTEVVCSRASKRYREGLPE